MKYSRGGPKPYMLANGDDILITTSHGMKAGMYEISSCRTILARRVELPTWLTDFERFSRKDLMDSLLDAMPTHDESGGHIYRKAPAIIFGGPAVGLDEEVYLLLRGDPKIRTVRFYVYSANYRLLTVWSISRAAFIALSRLVKGPKGFQPQMMVGLRAFA